MGNSKKNKIKKIIFLTLIVGLPFFYCLGADSFPLLDRLFKGSPKIEEKKKTTPAIKQESPLQERALDLQLEKEEEGQNDLEEGEVCKNFTDCRYEAGFYCGNKNNDPKAEVGRCAFKCIGLEFSPGLDKAGESLPCKTFFISDNTKDLSGRNLCCPDPDLYKSDRLKNLDISKVRGCKKSTDCFEGEFCAYVSTLSSRCAQFNSEGAKIFNGDCPSGSSVLAVGPDGSFCYNPVANLNPPKIDVNDPKDYSRDIDEENLFEDLIVKRDGSKTKTTKITKSSSGNIADSVTEKPIEYRVHIILHTPELFTSKAFNEIGKESTDESNDTEESTDTEDTEDSDSSEKSIEVTKDKKLSSKGLDAEEKLSEIGIQKGTNLKKNTNIKKSNLLKKGNLKGIDQERYYSYHEGETVNFSILVEGPPKSIPKDITAYSLNIIGKENPDRATGKKVALTEIKVKDIVSTSDFKDLVRHAPPLNICLINQDKKNKFTSALGSVFKLALPYFTYVNKIASEGLQMYSNQTSFSDTIPENRCSSKGDKVCGTNPIDICNCLTYGSWKYSTGSPIAKKSCDGNIPEDVSNDMKIKNEEDEKDKTKQDKSKPKCDKSTNEITCSDTNEIMVPSCGDGLEPDCSIEKKPICKRLIKTEKIITEVKAGEPLEAKKEDSAQEVKYELTKQKPECISYSDSANLFCKHVSSLEYNDKYEVGRCVSDYCDYLKSPEKKKNCCAGCESIYNKLTTEFESINYYEEKRIKSCIDFDGGHCSDFNYVSSCVNQKCYESAKESDQLKSCCITEDIDAQLKEDFVNKSQVSHEQGSVYTVLNLGNGQRKKIENTPEALIIQNFTLALPKNTKVEELSLVASIKDKTHKLKTAEAMILLIKDESDEDKEKDDDKKDEKEKCEKPIIASIKVSQDESINFSNEEKIDLPFTATSEKSELVIFEVDGLPSGLEVQTLSDSPSYKIKKIAGKTTDSGEHKITVKVANACKEVSEFKFTIVLPENIIEKSVKGTITEKDETEIQAKALIKPEDLQISYTPIFERLLTDILAKEGKVLNIKGVKSGNIVLAGSKSTIIADLNEGVNSIDPSKTEIILEGESNLQVLPSRPVMLPNRKVKLEVIAQGNKVEGNSRVIIRDKSEKRILAKTNIFIYKPQKVTSIDNKLIYGKPIVDRHILTINQDSKEVLIKLYGKNFIGNEVIINGNKAIIPKDNSLNLSSFSVVEFRNNNITVIESNVNEENNKLEVKVKVPSDFIGGLEEVFVSTPVGQTYTRINFPSFRKEVKEDLTTKAVEKDKVDRAVIKSIMKFFKRNK